MQVAQRKEDILEKKRAGMRTSEAVVAVMLVLALLWLMCELQHANYGVSSAALARFCEFRQNDDCLRPFSPFSFLV